MIDSALLGEPRPLPPTGIAPLPARGLALSPTDPLEAHKYAENDFGLAFQDVQVALRLAKVALRASTAAVAKFPRPHCPEAVSADFSVVSQNRPEDRLPAVTANPSRVAHVLYTSVPIDAVTADRTLYERDVMLAEAAAVLADKLVNPPVPHADAGMAGSLVEVSNWSLAEGVERFVGVSPDAPLTRDTFKGPDQGLAERDNILATAVARLAEWLANPFEVAAQLLVEVRAADAVVEPAEPYILTAVTADTRTWSAGPIFTGVTARAKVVYDRNRRSAQWFSAAGASAPPQNVDRNAVLSGDGARTSLGVPTGSALAVWKAQAARVATAEFSGASHTSFSTSGGQLQEFSSVVRAGPAGTVTFSAPGTVAETVRAAVMVWPRAVVRLPGGQSFSEGGPGSATWSVVLPAGLSYLLRLKTRVIGSGSFSVSTSGLSSLSFSTENGGLSPTAPVVSLSGSLSVSVAVSGPGQLVVEAVEFLPTAPPAAISLAAVAQVCGKDAAAAWSAEVGRPTVVEFEVRAASGAPAITLQFGTVPVGLLVGATAVTDRTAVYAPAYARAVRRWKTSLIDRVEGSFVSNYTKLVEAAGLKGRSETLAVRSAEAEVSAGAVIGVTADLANTGMVTARQIEDWTAEAEYPAVTDGDALQRAGTVVRHTPAGGEAGYYRGRKVVDIGSNRVGIPAGISPSGPRGKEFWGLVGEPSVFAYVCTTSGTTAGSTPAGFRLGDEVVADGSSTWRRRRPVFSESGRWSSASTVGWLTALGGAGGVLRPATAADVGRPALVPRGLRWVVSGGDGLAVMPAGFENAIPEFTALQAWMLTVGASVIHQDFWV